MNLEEAKEFYFQYSGFSFHMGREEPVKYNSFMKLDLSKSVLREWDEELLDNCFARLWSDPGRVWVFHEKILEIVRRYNCDANQYLSMLLNEMEKMENLDAFNITLIIENMAGRTETTKDGGVYLFCKASGLSVRMNDITERLINSCSAKYGVDDRFEEAVRHYRSAYDTWGTSKRLGR